MNAHDVIRQAAHDALCKLRIPHADHIWVSPLPYFDGVADVIESSVAAAGYTITLTDDGAGPRFSPDPGKSPGEGATPATNHRPTCGTTYGESCDGYCPTPAIDRVEIQDAIYKALPGEITWHESLAAADAVVALIEGAS